MLSVLQHLHAVDEDVSNADRVLMRLLERGAIGDGGGIKHNDIRVHARFDESTAIETEIGRRQRSEFTDRLGQREHVFVAHVLAKDARETAVCTRVGR